METELRIILLVSMLGIAGMIDVRSRKIPDVLWLIFGGIGALLYIWDHHSMTPYHIVTIFTSVFAAMMLWRWNIAGAGDSFAILAMTVILPVHYEFVMMPILILISSVFLAVVFVTMYNVSLNLSDVIRTKKIDVFSKFSESKYKKALAFVTIHRKRRFEKFVIPMENSMSRTPNVKSFVFLQYRNKATQQNKQLLQSSEVYVQSVPPLIAYMFGVTVFLLLPEILSMIF